MKAILCALMILVLTPGTAWAEVPWKAYLVLFVTGEFRPLAMMMGEFPEVFVKKADCVRFIESGRPDINAAIAKLGAVDVLHHELTCLQDETGEAT